MMTALQSILEFLSKDLLSITAGYFRLDEDEDLLMSDLLLYKLHLKDRYDEKNHSLKYDGKLIKHSINDIPEVDSEMRKLWWRFGKQHRGNDLHAVEYPNGDKEWYFDGNLHRGNGLPAVISIAEKCWFFHGKWYRSEMPNGVIAAWSEIPNGVIAACSANDPK